MNGKKIVKLGVPEGKLIGIAKVACEKAENSGIERSQIEIIITGILNKPESFTSEPFFGELAKELIIVRKEDEPITVVEKPWNVWGPEGIDPNAKSQMSNAMTVPCAIRGALMPDAHVGYSLPIGGVVATENCVVPMFVGVDIACRMKLTLIDMPIELVRKDVEGVGNCNLRKVLEDQTRFGVGCAWDKLDQPHHDVMDDPRWGEVEILKHVKDKAYTQLGTSGSGNHFVEYGIVNVSTDSLGVPFGKYIGIMSHSGSRGAGSMVCDRYTRAARLSLPTRLRERYKDLAWLSLDSEHGQEYWKAMNLMGDYASANHDVIHRNIVKALGAQAIATIENHHNFAWLEEHEGKKYVVHRKGATPAGEGVFGIIPGSMATTAYVVKGKGNVESLRSASHGSGRVLSRSKAKEKYNFNSVRKELHKRGVLILSAGPDEVPGVYKDIEEVMKAQQDLVEPVATFDPKIVKMCGDDSQAED